MHISTVIYAFYFANLDIYDNMTKGKYYEQNY